MGIQDNDLIKAADLILKSRKETENTIQELESLNEVLSETIKTARSDAAEFRVKYEKMQMENYIAKTKSETLATLAIIAFLFGAVCLGLLWIN